MLVGNLGGCGVFSQVPATEHEVKIINLSLDDDIISNLVLTHQACEPTTHTSTEKVAIIKEKMSQKPVKCYTLTRHPTSRIWQRDVEIQDGKKKIPPCVTLPDGNIRQSAACLTNIYNICQRDSDICFNWVICTVIKTDHEGQISIRWILFHNVYYRFMGLGVTVMPISPYAGF